MWIPAVKEISMLLSCSSSHCLSNMLLLGYLCFKIHYREYCITVMKGLPGHLSTYLRHVTRFAAFEPDRLFTPYKNIYRTSPHQFVWALYNIEWCHALDYQIPEARSTTSKQMGFLLHAQEFNPSFTLVSCDLHSAVSWKSSICKCKCKLCHHFLTLMSFLTLITFFLL